MLSTIPPAALASAGAVSNRRLHLRSPGRRTSQSFRWPPQKLPTAPLNRTTLASRLANSGVRDRPFCRYVGYQEKKRYVVAAQQVPMLPRSQTLAADRTRAHGMGGCSWAEALAARPREMR